MKLKQHANVSRETYLEQLRLAAQALSLQVDDLQLKKLLNYLDLLEKWSRVYNLTAIKTYSEMLKLHILDSMAFIPVLNSFSVQKRIDSLLDVGTGAGLPGLVIAILRPDIKVTMIDKVQKKISFVTQAIACLGLQNANAVHGRAGEFEFEKAFDAAISRAFSDLVFFSNLVSTHLHCNSLLFAMKGKMQGSDINISNWQHLKSVELCVPGLDAQRHVIVLESLRR